MLRFSGIFAVDRRICAKLATSKQKAGMTGFLHFCGVDHEGNSWSVPDRTAMINRMSAITFDTLKFAERLKAAGVPEAQAKAEAEALRDVFSEALDTTLATRPDILAIKSELKTDISTLDAKVDKLSWMMSILIALAVANFAKQFF